MDKPIHRVDILAFPEVEELDLVGPYECFAAWHVHAQGPPCQIVASTRGPFRARHGLRMLPQALLSDERPPPRLLILPGGDGSRRAAQNPAVQTAVQRCVEAGGWVASVCTGVRILHAAGMLQGRRVTTHQLAHAEVQGWPGVTLAAQRVVRDGPVWTAAGVSSGLDLSLKLIREMGDAEAASTVRQYVEYPEQSA